MRQNLSELDEDEKGVYITDTLGGPQEMTTISESGLCFLVFRSRKPQAHAILQIVYALCQTQAWREKRLLWRITQ
ncbi:BRO-N domain-containing protein [Bilophila wadsworthia]